MARILIADNASFMRSCLKFIVEKAGHEVVPKPEAVALVAYLDSLRLETPVYAAPLSVPIPVVDTNAPAAGGTNVVATNTPAK